MPGSWQLKQGQWEEASSANGKACMRAYGQATAIVLEEAGLLQWHKRGQEVQGAPVLGMSGRAAWNTLTGPQKLVSNTSCICLKSEFAVSPA